MRGDAERARREIPELLRAAEEASYAGAIYRLARALALLELSCGDASASWRAVAAHFAEVEELDDYLAHLAGSVGIEAAIGVRRPLYGGGAALPARRHVAGADTALHPLAHRCRGLLEAAQGDHESAIAALEAAAADPEPPQGVNPFELARTLLALGTVQRKARHKRAARESLQRAREIFEQLGARLWLENARSELGRIGGRVA